MYKKIRNIRFILFPLAMLYYFIIGCRNFLFNIGILRSKKFDFPVFCVGNLTVGGTGKTPVSEYLINILSKNFKTAFLSRGYKRKTKGFVRGDINSSPDTIGDEAFQVMINFPDITVAVDEKRVHGINQIIELEPATSVFVLDDAFQHRYVDASCKILLADYSRLIYYDFLLPVGRLREYFSARKRADIIIITKCPDHLSEKEKQIIQNKIKPFPHQHLFYSTIVYGSLYSLLKNEKIPSGKKFSILLMTGIAHPQPLILHLKRTNHSVECLSFPDHFDYNSAHFDKIIKKFRSLSGPDKIIIVTEKDAVKIKYSKKFPDSLKNSIYVIPISIRFLFNQGIIFNHLIHQYASKNK